MGAGLLADGQSHPLAKDVKRKSAQFEHKKWKIIVHIGTFRLFEEGTSAEDRERYEAMVTLLGVDRCSPARR